MGNTVGNTTGFVSIHSDSTTNMEEIDFIGISDIDRATVTNMVLTGDYSIASARQIVVALRGVEIDEDEQEMEDGF